MIQMVYFIIISCHSEEGNEEESEYKNGKVCRFFLLSIVRMTQIYKL